MGFKLLASQRGFRSFFLTQFWGAFNDNVFKNALVVLITYRGVQIGAMSAEQLVALSSGLFVLPFFLFSPLAGQICDKFDKAKIARMTKLAEVGIMLLASIGFLLDNYGLLLFILFLLGSQSAFFGPIKYSLIPDLVPESELTAGNALVELGTFLAILLGTIVGGWVSAGTSADTLLAVGLVGVAAIGYWTSLRIPSLPAGDAQLQVEYNPWPVLKSLYSIANQKKAVANSILGISWFWFFGVGVLSILPIYVKDYLFADEQVVTIFLAMFTLGIGLGSIVCEKLSFKRVEIGLVPIGSLGMTVFILDLYFLKPTWSVGIGQSLTLPLFLQQDIAPRLLVDFFAMSAFGGLFILPLYTLLQERTAGHLRSRVVAANNIANALFMVASSVVVLLFYQLKLNTAQIFAVFAVMNVLVAIYIYSLVPEFTLRFYAWVLSHIMYRVQIEGRENVPREGACILAANHVTYVDWLILSGACQRPARFVMYYKFFAIPLASILMRHAKVIPIAGAKENLEILEKAFATIRSELASGEVVCVFPEGKLTSDGQLSVFKPGIQRMLDMSPCPVVPVVLEGLWGSVFSRKSEKDRLHRRTIKVTFYPAIPASEFELMQLEEFFANKLGEKPPSQRIEPASV